MFTAKQLKHGKCFVFFGQDIFQKLNDFQYLQEISMNAWVNYSVIDF